MRERKVGPDLSDHLGRGQAAHPHPGAVQHCPDRLWAWAKTAAADLFPYGITLNLACPGYHATERLRQLGLPEGVPVGDPADFGRVVAFLCSQPAGFVSGAALQVDGARTLGLL